MTGGEPRSRDCCRGTSGCACSSRGARDSGDQNPRLGRGLRVPSARAAEGGLWSCPKGAEHLRVSALPVARPLEPSSPPTPGLPVPRCAADRPRGAAPCSRRGGLRGLPSPPLRSPRSPDPLAPRSPPVPPVPTMPQPPRASQSPRFHHVVTAPASPAPAAPPLTHRLLWRVITGPGTDGSRWVPPAPGPTGRRVQEAPVPDVAAPAATAAWPGVRDRGVRGEAGGAGPVSGGSGGAGRGRREPRGGALPELAIFAETNPLSRFPALGNGAAGCARRRRRPGLGSADSCRRAPQSPDSGRRVAAGGEAGRGPACWDPLPEAPWSGRRGPEGGRGRSAAAGGCGSSCPTPTSRCRRCATRSAFSTGGWRRWRPRAPGASDRSSRPTAGAT